MKKCWKEPEKKPDFQRNPASVMKEKMKKFVLGLEVLTRDFNLVATPLRFHINRFDDHLSRDFLSFTLDFSSVKKSILQPYSSYLSGLQKLFSIGLLTQFIISMPVV
ncbi:MAG TPA: hypothetical protein PLT47_00770 [Bacteroidales bacterium]|nr:hypothetical protein [Bacteroidales bacterium]HQI69251.1 hypothetical protein [Bacteroidales bacterium]